MKPNKKTPEEMVVYLKRQITDMEEDAYKLKAELTRLKERNREMLDVLQVAHTTFTAMRILICEDICKNTVKLIEEVFYKAKIEEGEGE